MTKEYTGFPISNFRTGFDEALEPWLLPRDAFQVLKNAHLYRGVIEKIPGYNIFTRMMYRSFEELNGTINGINKTFTITLARLPTTGNTIIQAITDPTGTSAEVFTDDSNGILTGSAGGTGTINYSTGAVSITFGTNAPTNITFAGIQYNSVFIRYDRATDGTYPIMGIKQYIQENGTKEVIVFNTRRAGKIISLSGAMEQDQQIDYGITEIPHENIATISGIFNNTIGPFVLSLANNIVPGELKLQVFDSSSTTANLLGTIVDNGLGGLTGALLDPAAVNVVNYYTGKVRLTFLANRPATDRILASYCTYGNYFTGDFTNFFSTVNYQSKLFLTNAKDSPRYYDGTCVKFLNTNLSAMPNMVPPYQLDKPLHVAVQRERLLLLAPFVDQVPAFNAIYWSTAGDPLDFTNDEQLFAPTSESIRTFSTINTDLVVRFSNSERVFRYTGDAFSPFRWDSTNLIWRCDASYSAINYDSWFSSVGAPAIVGSDGVNVKRVDEIIPDFTLNQRVNDQQPVLSIDQNSMGQCYGERFDDFKEGWLCYKEYSDDSTGGVQPSDSVLAFNYLDGTYAVYTFPFSCLGFGRVSSVDVWGDAFDKWGEANYAWKTFTQTEQALIDLSGDQNGIVYELGIGNSITDMSGTVIPCLFEAITKDFNPFVEAGELARFGYVDFLVSSNDDTKFRVQFYKDNQLTADFDAYYQETTLTLTGNTQYKVWKRIYVGAVGKSHTMRIYQNADDFDGVHQNQPIRIHAMVPYFKAAGRIFN